MPKKKNSKTQTIKVARVEDLTPKQQAFIREYPVDFNATQAAIRAGYSVKGAQQQASRLLLNVVIQESIRTQVDRRNKAIEKKVDVSAAWVIDRLVKTVDRCMQITPVMEKIDGEWVETGEFKFEHTGSNKALEMIGRYLGMWRDNFNLTGTLNIQHLEDVPSELLFAVLEKIKESGQKEIIVNPKKELR